MKEKRKHYSVEFKAKAINLAEQTSVTEAAEQLGISAGMLSRWRRKEMEEGAEMTNESVENVRDLRLLQCQQENVMLKAQLTLYKNIVMTMLKEIDPTFDQGKM